MKKTKSRKKNRSEKSLSRELESSMSYQTFFNADGITLHVTDGDVDMTGVSDNAAERMQAETWLNTNPGVRFVKNSLRLRK